MVSSIINLPQTEHVVIFQENIVITYFPSSLSFKVGPSKTTVLLMYGAKSEEADGGGRETSETRDADEITVPLSNAPEERTKGTSLGIIWWDTG